MGESVQFMALNVMRISTATLYAIAALATKEGLQPAVAAAGPTNLEDRSNAADRAADAKHSIATADITSVMSPEAIAAAPEGSPPLTVKPELADAFEAIASSPASPAPAIHYADLVETRSPGFKNEDSECLPEGLRDKRSGDFCVMHRAPEGIALQDVFDQPLDSPNSDAADATLDGRTAEPMPEPMPDSVPIATTLEWTTAASETTPPPRVDLAAEVSAANFANSDDSMPLDPPEAASSRLTDEAAIAPPETSPQTWTIAQSLRVEPMSADAIAQLPTLPSTFDTVQGNWAEDFVRSLERADIVQGFRETGAIRPDLPVTRAQYAALINQAFSVNPIRPATSFTDVPGNYWGQSAIQSAYRMGFLEPLSAGRFAPEARISRAEAIAALVQGLQLRGGDPSVLNRLDDAGTIPVNLRGAIATAMDGTNPATGQPARVVVNYPNVNRLNPADNATRADVMAFVHQALVSAGNLPPIASNARQYIANTGSATRPTTARAVTLYVPDLNDLELEQERLRALETFRGDGRSPGLTILSPTGFGVDNWTPFIGATFQSETRYSNVSDGGMVFGVGLGDAREAVGVEVSYTVASFGTNRDFGTGGFNVRIHRRFSEDFAGAIGWNGIITTGDVDFEDSVYGVLTKIFTLNEDITEPFSRIAVNAGIGNGMFRTEDAVDDGDDTLGVFGSVAIRLAEPVSLITEWTGQDLAIGLSIAPFPNSNFVITPAIRDITGAGDEARFVLGGGISF
jgi:hypothetical protein